jgi:lipopolysaccharide heptosyltransferase II
MNISLLRALDRIIGVALCALLSLVARVLPRRQPAHPPRRILVILLSEMGSLVLAYPMFARLKERYPAASIHVLQIAKHREVLDLLGVIPPENVLTVDDRSLIRFAWDSLKLLGKFRQLRFDAVLDCELFARISGIYGFFTRAPLHAGFDRYTQEGLYRGSFINRPVLYNPYHHISRQFLTLAAALESHTVPVGKDATDEAPFAVPRLALAPGEVAQSEQRLHAAHPALRGRPLALIYPGAGILPIRAWPLAHFQTVAKQLLQEGYAVAVIGLPSDRELGEAIVRHCGSEHCVSLAGYTRSVRELLVLFGHAALLVTNDGGPAQFSSLVPVPTITLFGPETPALYGPLGTHAVNLHRALPCSPCLTAYNHRRSPCDGDNQCLKRIAPEEVLVQVRSLRARPASAATDAGT